MKTFRVIGCDLSEGAIMISVIDVETKMPLKDWVFTSRNDPEFHRGTNEAFAVATRLRGIAQVFRGVCR